MYSSDFRELLVWQKSMDLAVEIYAFERSLPPEEKYCLGDQIRRCTISIPSNIAEGHSRNSTKDYIRFVSISRGSVAELQTQLILSMRLGYLSEEALSFFYSRLIEIDKMLYFLIRSLYRSLEKQKETLKNQKSITPDS